MPLEEKKKNPQLGRKKRLWNQEKKKKCHDWHVPELKIQLPTQHMSHGYDPPEMLREITLRKRNEPMYQSDMTYCQYVASLATNSRQTISTTTVLSS